MESLTPESRSQAFFGIKNLGNMRAGNHAAKLLIYCPALVECEVKRSLFMT